MAGELTEIPLSPAEQVVSSRHDELVALGIDAAEAADRLRRSLAVRAVAVQLSEEFWSWLRS